MKAYYKLFWNLFLIEITLTPFLVILFYLTGIDLVFFFKIPLLLSFAGISLFHLRKKLKWTSITILFALAGTLSLVYGIVVNYELLDLKILPSIYTFLMPIFSVSFGIYMAKEYDQKMHKYVGQVMRLSFFIIAIVLLIYAYLHFITKQIPYFGFSSRMDLVLAYMLSSSRILLFGVGFILVLLSGKRSITLNVLLIALVYFSGKILSRKLKDQLILYTSIVSLVGVGIYAYQTDQLRRFQDMLAFDVTDERAAYIATSGRWNEVVGIYNYMQDKPIAKYIGAGIGGKYRYEDTIYGYRRTEMKHYAHLSIMGYAFTYGIPFTILLYSLIIYLIIIGRKHARNFFYLGFVMLIFGSLFGSNLFIDHKIWVFVGVVYILSKDKTKSLPISYLSR